jgi:hypothetical protein
MRGRRVIVAVAVLGVLAGSASFAWGGDPPGNNGTVNVTGILIDTKVGNDPHIAGCTVYVNFYGFDRGPLMGTADIRLIAPSGEGDLWSSDPTPIGEDPAGGANDLDASLMADLTDKIAASGATQTDQGFHVEVTTHAEGSIGADVKHKTFWVNGCGGEGGGEGSSD